MQVKMKKIISILILISLINVVQADRWSESDYKYFCAEYTRQIFGWNYKDYYNTSETNATKCVLYPKYGYPKDFWVGVPDDIDDRDRCVFRSDCPARIWAREWFDMAFDQNNTEDQVCGMCNAIYYAVRSFTPYLKEDADRDDIMQLLHDFQWLAMESTPSGYCIEGRCGMSCVKAIGISVDKAIIRNDNKWQKVFDNAGIKVVETGVECPICPPLTCPECECRVCNECDECTTCDVCSITQDDIDSKDIVIDGLNKELISCRSVENDVSSVDAVEDTNWNILYALGIVGIVFIVVALVFYMDRS